MLSSLRVFIEHVHSGIKRLRMARSTVRVRGEWWRDTLMVVASGLHNFRVLDQHYAYLAPECKNC